MVRRELLNRGDDDASAGVDRFFKLAGGSVNLFHDARGLFELRDRVLELPVEHNAVGDYDGRVKDRLVADIVEVDRLVGGPADRY